MTPADWRQWKTDHGIIDQDLVGAGVPASTVTRWRREGPPRYVLPWLAAWAGWLYVHGREWEGMRVRDGRIWLRDGWEPRNLYPTDLPKLGHFLTNMAPHMRALERERAEAVERESAARAEVDRLRRRLALYEGRREDWPANVIPLRSNEYGHDARDDGGSSGGGPRADRV